LKNETAGNDAEEARVQQKSGDDLFKKIVPALLLFPRVSVQFPAVSSFKQLMSAS
jgi:hypothetical protein